MPQKVLAISIDLARAAVCFNTTPADSPEAVQRRAAP